MSFKPEKFQNTRSEREWFVSGGSSSENPTNAPLSDQMLKSQASTIGEGCTLRGAFECRGDLQIDGFVEGDIVVDGTIRIGEAATIRANIRARSVFVFGKVIGDILCSDRIELHAGAQVRGNLKTRRMIIQDGVIFDGRCEMAIEKKEDEV